MMTPKPQTFNCDDLAHLPEALVPLTTEKRWVVWRWEESGKNGANGKDASNGAGKDERERDRAGPAEPAKA